MAQRASLSIKENMIWNATGSLIYLGCQWLVTVLVAQLSSDYEAAGLLAIAMAVANLFVPIALYKIRSFQVSDINNEYSTGEYVAFRLITIIIGFILTSLYALFTNSVNTFVVIEAYLVFRGSEVFTDVLHGVDQKHCRMDYCGKSMMARGVLLLLSFGLAMTLTDNLLLSIISMSVTNYPILLVDIKWASQFERLAPVFSVKKMKALALECFPAVAGMVCCSAVTSFVRQYYGSLAGEEALGIYATVCTPAVIIQAGASYVYAPILNTFAEFFSKGDKKSFARILRKAVFSIAVLTVMAIVVSYFFGSYFLNLIFGEEIASYWTLLSVALISTAATAYAALASDVEITVRDMKGNLLGNAVSLIIALLIMHNLIMLFDMNGISLSIAISYLCGTAYMFLSMHRVLRLNSSKVNEG